MSNPAVYAAAAIAVMTAVTLALRVAPFVIFSDGKTPAYVTFLGKFLPCSVMAMLVVYCMRGISFVRTPFGVPELAAAAVTAALHVWRRNTLLSIIVGTACYMLLIRVL